MKNKIKIILFFIMSLFLSNNIHAYTIQFNGGTPTADIIYTFPAAGGDPNQALVIKSGQLKWENVAYPSFFPNHYQRDQRWELKTYADANDRYILNTPNRLAVDINGIIYTLSAQKSYDLSSASNWDSIATDYTVAANRAGKNFYVYACRPGSGTTPIFLLSANSTVPTGYSVSTSRKVGGFHCLCVSVGTISGHTLTGYVAGDILPASIWDLTHCPISNPEGMVWSSWANIWVDIYLQSGTSTSTGSVYNATITDTRTWMNHVDDLAAVSKKPPTDIEFQIIAYGSNEETNITGSADPVTTGGHSDTASRRMISNIGCEDCCGALWQWLQDQSYQFAAAANHTHQVTVTGLPETVTSGNPSVDVAPAFGWYDLGSQGSLYRQGTYGDVKLLAGGTWADGTYCGSRCRYSSIYRWGAFSSVGARGRSEPKRAE